VDPHAVGGRAPEEIDSEEPADGSHEFDTNARGEGCFKPFFDAAIGREVDEVVDVASDINRVVGFSRAMAKENTWVMRTGFESDGEEVLLDILVPVARRPPESVQGLLELPVAKSFRPGTSRWRRDGDYFVVG
jgi:hypothetical protein